MTDNTARRYDLNRTDALTIHALLRSEIATHHNWIASAVERSEIERAQKLVKDMRNLQRIAAGLNVEAHDIIDKV